MNKLQTLRNIIDKPIVVNSGCRCKSHNKAAGGTQRSFHTQGKAADIRVPGIAAALLHECVKQSRLFTGIGKYSTFVHVDIRKAPTRWNG